MPSSLASTLGRKARCPPTLMPRKKTINAMLPIVAATPGHVRYFESDPAGQASVLGNMRTAGMIGGLGPESTIDYYRSIIARYRARKPDAGYPRIIINSLDVDKGIALLDAGRLGDLADYLAAGVHLLVRAGAGFGFMAANTPHLVFDEVQRRSPIPLLSIV